MDKKLEILNVNFKYNNDNVIFDHLNLCLNSNKINIILGESGVGKTTLLSLVLGLKKCDNGEILYNGQNINYLAFRRNVASYIDQEGTCFDNMTIEEHFKFVDEILVRKSMNSYVSECLVKTGLDEKILKKYPNNLSGGERKRFLIALSLYKQSEVILLDEPTSSLDDDNCQLFIDLLNALVKDHKMVIVVTHDKRLMDCDAYKYEIKDKCINSLCSVSPHVDSTMIETVKNRYLVHYINYKNKKQKFLILLLIIIGSLLIGYIGETFVSNFRLSQMISDDLNNSIVKEIHFRKVNFDTSLVDGFRSYDHPHYYNGRTLAMSDDEITKIKEIDGVKDVYEYPVLYSDGYSTENGIKESIKSINVDGVNHSLNDATTISVFPTYTDDHNIYISRKLADMLHISDMDFDDKLHFTFSLGLPVAQYNEISETTYNKYDEKTNSWNPYITSDLNYLNVIVEEKEVTLLVSNIVDNNNDNDYFCGSEYYFMMNYEDLDALIKYYNGKNLNDYNYLNDNIEPYKCEDYIVFVDSINDLENVDQKMTQLNYLYDVNCRYLLARETLDIYYTNSIENFINSIVLSLISVSMFTIVLAYYLKLRGKEILLLNNFGLSKKEIDFVLNFEIVVLMCICLLINAGIIIWRIDNPGFILKFYLEGTQLFLVLFGFELFLVLIIVIISIACVKYLSRGILYDRL